MFIAIDIYVQNSHNQSEDIPIIDKISKVWTTTQHFDEDLNL